jgi:hypothetical protein
MDLTTITTFLSQYGTWGILLAGVLTLTSDWWLPWLKGKLKPSPPAVGPSEDADVADVLALHALQSRAKRSGCPKLVAAVRDVEVCFFNHGEPSLAQTGNPPAATLSGLVSGATP